MDQKCYNQLIYKYCLLADSLSNNYLSFKLQIYLKAILFNAFKNSNYEKFRESTW